MNYRTEDVLAKSQDATSGKCFDQIIEVDLAANAATDLAALGSDSYIVAYGKWRFRGVVLEIA